VRLDCIPNEAVGNEIIRHYYLGNEEVIAAAMNAVAKQGKA